MIEELLSANKNFMAKKTPVVSKYPRLRLAILTCMDARLVELVEPALGLARGDAKVIKNAGNILDQGALRSLVVAVYLLGVGEIIVIGHRDCGMVGVDVQALRQKMLARGVPEGAIAELNLVEWIGTFADETENVRRVVMQIRNSPLIPRDVKIHGLMMDPDTGCVEVVNQNQ
ncbi:beta-class carbonic anhydrase [Desulfotomaculum copahuensis]|uniref:carbonic anhydrase n=1 Tax=Desulfotomaculum copahuensis TaxID=1838280 RepID=A0A1B7LEJ6_9FIRM|nr:carbonic anhydrase [Desulfotomaculum copahuensis]OAT81709.1 hypothetical protein A6M21_09860 [Desulfotomaculum copahuensis]